MEIILPIYTDRLILREFIESDWISVHEYFSNSDVTRFMVRGATNEKETKDYVQRVIDWQSEAPRNSFVFAIILKANGSLIGGCDIHIENFEHKIGEIIYRLNPSYWGNGYGTEACKAMINFGFKILGLHRIEAICDVRNISSIKLLENIGMRKEGYIREHKFVKGEWRNSYLYSILEQEHHNKL